jgi:ferredoxin
MRILVDRVRCEGHGLCMDVAPELFEIDDDGDLVTLFDEAADVPEPEAGAAAEAVRVCPVSALSTTLGAADAQVRA